MSPKETYFRAGKIHYEVIERSKKLITPGASLLVIAQAIEKDIASYPEASLAFPVNLQLNNEVHYSPLPGDTRTISKEDIIKVDIGVHVEGYIADGAYTIALNKDYQDMVDFTEKVLRETEIEWYGENHEEKPIPMDDFSLIDIYYGKAKDREEGYYWGNKPEEFFEGKYETKEGFVASL